MLGGRGNSDTSVGHSVTEDGPSILYCEGDVFDTVSVVDQVMVHLFGGVFMVDWAEDKGGSLVVPDDVACYFPLSCLKSFVGEVIKAKSGSIVRSSLFGIADPEG
jgi:hypothetical protein